MKAKAHITVTRRYTYEADISCVDDSGWSDARDAVLDKAAAENPGTSISVVDLVVIEGPLVASVKWCDLHGPGDVILAKAAFGHKLDKAECDAIKTRLESLGLKVFSRWNIGSEAVSFKADGRVADNDFTDEEEAMLCGSTLVEETNREGLGLPEPIRTENEIEEEDMSEEKEKGQWQKVPGSHIMQFFAYEHLPEHLQAISKPFCEIANWMEKDLPNNPERSAGLRKLMEAKDCAVRAQLAK